MDLKCKFTPVNSADRSRGYLFSGFSSEDIGIGIQKKNSAAPPEVSMDSSSSVTVTQREQLMVEQQVFQIYRLLADLPRSSQSFM